MKVTMYGIKESFNKFVDKCKSFISKEIKQEESTAVYECRNKIGSHHQPNELKIWQILEGALEYLAMTLEEYDQGVKNRFVYHAISEVKYSNEPCNWGEYHDAKTFLLNKIQPFGTLEGWLVANKHVDGFHVFQTEEGFAKLQLTRKMWLLDMIAECKEKDI